MLTYLKCDLVESGARGTDTFKTAGRILALTTGAEHWVQGTLVNVVTLLATSVHLVARVGQTPVAPRQVLTRPVVTDVVALGGALVDVVPGVGEATAMGTQPGVLC